MPLLFIYFNEVFCESIQAAALVIPLTRGMYCSKLQPMIMLTGSVCSSGLTRTTTSCRERQDGNREEKVSTCHGRKGQVSFVVLYDSSSHTKKWLSYYSSCI